MDQAAAPLAHRAVIYLRVSTAMQMDTDVSEEGFSIPAQREACIRTAERLGAEVVEEYVDRGESARSAARPQLQAMLARMKEERDIDYVIVHKVDRLARSREDDVQIVLAIRQAGGQLVSATENIDETPSGKLLHGIMATIAEFYSQNLASEVLKGLRQKAKLGGTPSKAPVGYLNVIERSDGKTIRTVIVDKDRAPHIQWAFEAYATGDYLIRELAEALEERGLKTPPVGKKGGQPMSISRVEQMLANPYYIGIVTFEGVQYPGRHDPLISAELWDRVQTLKQSRAISKEKPYEHPHYLKGTVFCGTCGTRMGVTKIKNRHGSEYDYFYCLGRQKRTASCSQKYVAMDVIEDKVEEVWTSIQLPDEQIRAIERCVLDYVQVQGKQQHRALKEQTKRLSALEEERIKLMGAYYASAIPIEVLKREQERIGSEMRACQTILDGAQTDIDAIEAGLENLLELIADCGQLYKSAPPAIRRQFNQAVFERIVIDDDQVGGFYLRSPFKELVGPTMEEMETQNNDPERRRYHRARSGLVLPEQIEASLREIFQSESGTTTNGRPALRRSSPKPILGAPGSNVGVLVPPTGFEPVPPP